MDCFETHYYQLNRKFLLLVGQWPYQNFADRIKRWILYLCIVLPAFAAQIARVVTREVDFDTCIEIVSDEVSLMVTFVRYFAYAINNKKSLTNGSPSQCQESGSEIRFTKYCDLATVPFNNFDVVTIIVVQKRRVQLELVFFRVITSLLDNMKSNWESLMSTDEIEIFCEAAEGGRLYSLHYAIYVCTVMIVTTLLILSPPLLVYMNLINSSYTQLVLFPAEYFIDNEKYYYLTLAHLYLVILVSLAGILSTDLLYVVFMYHSVGMFKVTCHRLEHAFDQCNHEFDKTPGRSNACERIASAVGYHRRALSFTDTLAMAYDWTNCISLVLSFTNIIVSLYWAVTSKGHVSKMMIGLILSAGQMLHMLAVHIPAQMITDSSFDIVNKVYSSLWYNAHVKEQTLLLLTMHRGSKPNHMMMGGFYPMAIENYASEVKAAFSYFTMLLSLK